MERVARIVSLLTDIESSLNQHVAVLGFQSLTVTSTPAVTLTIPATATRAYITVEDNSVRVTWDGTTPTAAIGHLCPIGTSIELDGHDLTHFKAIAVGSSAVLSVTYSTEV